MADQSLFRITVKRRGPRLPELEARLYGPALVHAINNTIERIQEHTRARMPTAFTLRSAKSRALFNRLVSIDPDEFASDRLKRYRGRVGIKASINAAEGVRRFAPRVIRFEFGGVEHPHGAKPLYVPDLARISKQREIPRHLYPKALGVLEARQIEGGEAFRARGKKRKTGVHTTATGKIQLKGKHRTFALDPRFHPDARRLGVFQRVNREETDRLWIYLRRPQRIPRLLTYREDAERIYQQHFIARLTADLEKRAVRNALRGAR